MPPKGNTKRKASKCKSMRNPKRPPSPVPAVCVQEEEPQGSQDNFADPYNSQDESDSTKEPASSEQGQPPNEKPKKKSKKTCRLGNEQEEGALIEWVEENQCLWNLKHRDFKNKALKNRMWEDKASELGYDVETLKTWYTDLRDWNTKLQFQRSGDGQKDFTDRKKWVMDRFTFLRSAIRHRRSPVKRVKEALAIARGDLDEEERIAAEDKLVIEKVDEENPNDCEDVTASYKPKKQKKDVEDPIITEMRKKFADAQADLTSVRNALSVTEPPTERTTFLDWVREVCKNKQKYPDQRPPSTLPPSSTSQSALRGYSGFQPMPNQWNMPSQHPQYPWQNQNSEYIQTNTRQPCLNPDENTEDTSQVVSSTLLDLDTPYTAY